MSAPMTCTLRWSHGIPAHREVAVSRPDGDHELMARIAQREAHALTQLYERHAPRALGLALRIVRDRDLAEQVIQDAFWKVWLHAGEFESTRGSVGTWLFTIVRNLAIDQLRRRRDELSLDDDQQSEALQKQTSGHDVGETVGRRLRSEEIRRALETLPEAQRRVLELSYFEGLTRREIADRLGEPLGTIHTRARLGLGKLGQLLEPV